MEIKKVLEIRPLEALPYVYEKIIGGDKRSSRLTAIIILYLCTVSQYFLRKQIKSCCEILNLDLKAILFKSI